MCAVPPGGADAQLHNNWKYNPADPSTVTTDVAQLHVRQRCRGKVGFQTRLSTDANYCKKGKITTCLYATRPSRVQRFFRHSGPFAPDFGEFSRAVLGGEGTDAVAPYRTTSIESRLSISTDLPRCADQIIHADFAIGSTGFIGDGLHRRGG